jgi:hypothetical protein
MRRLTILFLAVVLILVFCFGAALVLPTLQPKPAVPANITPKSIGITEIHESALIRPIDMQYAITEIEKYQMDLAVNRTNTTIRYIGAKNLDAAGEATSWIFGVGKDNMTTIYTYDRNGVAEIPWDAGLPEQEIDLSTVLTPRELITSNHIRVPVTNASQEQSGVMLEMMDGSYIVTYPPGSSPHTLTFNATTGALISSYD